MFGLENRVMEVVGKVTEGVSKVISKCMDVRMLRMALRAVENVLLPHPEIPFFVGTVYIYMHHHKELGKEQKQKILERLMYASVAMYLIRFAQVFWSDYNHQLYLRENEQILWKKIASIQENDITKSSLESKVCVYNTTIFPITVEGRHPIPGTRHFCIWGNNSDRKTIRPHDAMSISGGPCSYGIGRGLRLCHEGVCRRYSHGDVVSAEDIRKSS